MQVNLVFKCMCYVFMFVELVSLLSGLSWVGVGSGYIPPGGVIVMYLCLDVFFMTLKNHDIWDMGHLCLWALLIIV